MIARERAAPLVSLRLLTANHFPWTTSFRPDLTPDWKGLGNDPQVDEYIRRQTMSARDYRAFVDRLERDFPDESFLLVRFGDHQPAISARLIDPSLDDAAIGRRIMTFDPRYFTTYYAIDVVNFKPAEHVVGAGPARSAVSAGRHAGGGRAAARSVVRRAEANPETLQRHRSMPAPAAPRRAASTGY